jgi:hypothetical protein
MSCLHGDDEHATDRARTKAQGLYNTLAELRLHERLAG